MKGDDIYGDKEVISIKYIQITLKLESGWHILI